MLSLGLHLCFVSVNRSQVAMVCPPSVPTWGSTHPCGSIQDVRGHNTQKKKFAKINREYPWGKTLGPMVWHGGRSCVPTQWETPARIGASQSLDIGEVICASQSIVEDWLGSIELDGPWSMLVGCSILGAWSLGNLKHNGIPWIRDWILVWCKPGWDTLWHL